ncbi:hypothetical protein AR505_1538 [methanogenic archaeon ISO4-H5]|nr:hypothetical protein AR505_1538 [methanogenic archaeon ISO4-H5]
MPESKIHTTKLFDFDKPPILMVGSGIPKRYLSDFKTWDELLQAVAMRMGIDKRTYIAHKHIAEDSPGKSGTLPELAYNLRQLLFEQLVSGKVKATDIFTSEEELKMYDSGIDPFKILISSEVVTYSVLDDSTTMKELESFRNLINIIPAVITTNYDCFLENEVFKEFSVYTSVSDYYYFHSEGIGEIYKIHGSADDPESLIVTSKDYEGYSEKSKVVSAKVLSMMCDYPLLIIGYSLSDDDVSRMIYDLMSSLNEKGLQTIKKNMIYIVYEKDLPEPIPGTKTFKNEQGEFTLRTIRTSDFNAIYEELGAYTPSASPREIRKIRQLVKNIVLTAQPTEKQYMKIGIDSLDSEDSDRITLILTDKEVGRLLKEYTPITPDLLINDYLAEESAMDPDSVVRYFSVYSNLQPNMYIPLYPYIRSSKLTPDSYSAKLKEFLTRKEEQLQNKILNSRKIFERTDISITDPFHGIKDYNKPTLVMYLLDSGKITIPQAKEMLIQLKELYGKGNNNFDTNFKCTVTLLSKLQE